MIFNILEKYEITYTEIVPTVLFVLNKLKVDVTAVLAEADGDKKMLATQILPASDFDKGDYQFAFKMADGGHDISDLVMKRITSNLGNTAKYNELAEWLGITADQGEAE